MKISIPVNHNYYEESPIFILNKAFNIAEQNKAKAKKIKETFSSVYELKLGAEQLSHVKIINFKRKPLFDPDRECLILKLYSKKINDDKLAYIIQTGLYAGVVYYNDCKFNITTKYGDAFLKRMLNFVNDIYVDNIEIKAKKDQVDNQFLYIIAYLFIQSLEKAAILGLPQQYKKHQERGHKVRGNINFNDFLKRDIPFQGKLTSTFKERLYVQEIVDVLYLTLHKLKNLFSDEINKRILSLNQLLKQHYSGQYVTYEKIQKAKSHQSINNPLYRGFKKVLEYAEIILLDKDIMPDSSRNQLSTTGYLFDIAELYELYLEKLLTRNFPEWNVNGQVNLPIYQNQFYNRSMLPDIVMKHNITGKIAVFDAKFKTMNFHNKDVDRMDLHQIHSYSGYYQRDQLVACGLIYPLSSDNRDSTRSCSSTVYGNTNNQINFIIDGVYVSDPTEKELSMEKLIEHEYEFVERIRTVLNNASED